MLIFTLLIDTLFPTHSNGYSPYIFRKRGLGIFCSILIIFNFLSSTLFPSFVEKSHAASYSSIELMGMANSSRAGASLPLLSYSKTLESAAYAKAQDMLNKNYWAHFGPNGESPWQFIVGAGYVYQYAGENLGRGFTDAQSLHNAWMASPSHYANIMKPEFRDIGIAIVEGNLQGEDTILVVQLFGAVPGAQNTENNQNIVTSNLPEPVSSSTSIKTNTSQNLTTKSRSSVSSISTKASPPKTPTIDNPANNSILNSDKFKLSGSTEIGSIVQIFKDEQIWSELNPDDSGRWELQNLDDLTEGEYSFKVRAIKNNLESDFSIALNIKIDKTPPKLKLISVESNSEKAVNDRFILVYQLDIEDADSPDIKIFRGNDEPLAYNYDSETKNIRFEVNIEDTRSYSVIVNDRAQNEVIMIMTSKELNERIFEHLKSKMGGSPVSCLNSACANESKTSNLTTIFNDSKIFANLNSMSLKQKVNLIFACGILILLVIDFLVLYKKKINLNRAKSLLHIPQFAAIIALALLSSFGIII